MAITTTIMITGMGLRMRPAITVLPAHGAAAGDA
jgi:hypothetical protein